MQEINSIHKVDKSPNDINSCEKTCVPKSDHEKLKIELKQLKGKMSESPNALKDYAKCKNKTPLKQDSSTLIRLKDENDKLKQEVKNLSSSYNTLVKGEMKFGEMLSSAAVQFDKNGLGFLPIKDKCKPAPSIKLEKPKWCVDCMTEGHFAFECNAPPKKPTPSHLRAFAFNAHYVLKRGTNGKVKAHFMGKKDNNKPMKLWVPKCLIPKSVLAFLSLIDINPQAHIITVVALQLGVF